jgi:hypothetical protein
MRSLVYSVTICTSVLLASAAFAGNNQGGNNQGGNSQGGTRGAPAPEMGASLLGLGIAGALVFYVLRRRRSAHV